MNHLKYGTCNVRYEYKFYLLFRYCKVDLAIDIVDSKFTINHLHE
jgi:hypothetical protein